jgi:hypothetical protein
MFAQTELSPAAGPRRLGLWLFVVVSSAVLVIVAAAVPVFGWIAEQTSTSHWSAVHPITNLQVRIASGDVSVAPGPAGSVSMVQTLTWNTTRPKVTETWAGDALTIAMDCSNRSPFPVNDCGVQLQLTVPASVAVQAAADSGDVTVAGLSGDVRAQTTSGDVELDGDTGYIWARAESGGVNGNALRSRRIDAATVSGDLYLTFAAPPTTVSATVESGSATVVVPQSTTYRVSGQTQSGERTVEAGLADTASPRIITIDTTSGDANLGYPDNYGN